MGKALAEKETVTSNKGEKLIEYLGRKTIKNLIKEIKGEQGHVIGYTRKGEQKNLKEYLKNLIKQGKNPIINVVGAFPKGTFKKQTQKILDEKIAITKYPLTTSAVLCRITTTLEAIATNYY